MPSFQPHRGGSPALPALLRATHLFGLALGSALGRLRDSGATAARLFERAEECALLLRMTREAAGILGARWDKVPERHRPHYTPEQRFRILLVAEDLRRKLDLGLIHYAHFRPHQALGGATPAEIYLGRTQAQLSAIPPPRGRPGEGSKDSPFHIEYLDAERRLPILIRKAA